MLAAQFESFVDPLIIMLTVPLSMTGALALLQWTGGTMNVYSQIGLITLVGLITKHGILIVEFANQLRDQGKALVPAVIEAASLRLRPILMTTGAMVLGAVPLALRHRGGRREPSADRHGDRRRHDAGHAADAVRACRPSTRCWRAARGRRTRCRSPRAAAPGRWSARLRPGPGYPSSPTCPAAGFAGRALQEPMRQIVLDTETTGLSAEDGHRIIEIGCLEVRQPPASPAATLHLYVNPERDIDAGALAVHGITREMLQDKPRFGDVVDARSRASSTTPRC